MAEDRLRGLIDDVLASLDDPAADGAALARRAHFSRDHHDRLLAAALLETPVGLRRRLLLERAAWQLRVEGAAPKAVAPLAGYGSLAAFSRAFRRAYGTAPTAFAAGDGPVRLAAPNGIHFHPPAGLLVPGGPEGGGGRPVRDRDLVLRLLAQHLDRTRELLVLAAALDDETLGRPLRPGFVVLAFEGAEESAALMAERLVHTLEIWFAAMAGRPLPEGGDARLLARFDRVARELAAAVRAIADRGAWDDAFVDALCEPPQSFTYAGVVAHVLAYGTVRREMLANVLAELGADVPPGDPILWEERRRQA